MAWSIKRRPWFWLWKPYSYELYNSAYGMVWGKCWTRRAAERRLRDIQSDWFAS